VSAGAGRARGVRWAMVSVGSKCALPLPGPWVTKGLGRMESRRDATGFEALRVAGRGSG